MASGDSQHSRLTGEIMKTRAEKRAKSANAMIFVLWLLALPAGSFGQGPSPAMGERLGQGTFVSPNFVLNLDVQVHGPDGTPLNSIAVVTLYASSGLPVSTATTKGTRALFTQLAPGQYYVEVEAPGYWKMREDAMVQPTLSDNIVTVSLTPAVAGSAPPVYSHTPLLKPDVQKDLNKAVAALKDNKLDSAQKQMKAVLRAAPNHPDSLYIMGLLAEKKGNTAEAQSFWNKAISSDPNYGLSVYALGQSYLREGNYQKADELGQKAVELQPNSWRAHFLLASVAFRQDRYGEAVSHGERALELGKEQAAGISIVLAQALAVQGRRDEAIQALNQYLATKPESSNAEKAGQLLARIQSKADQFVIAGREVGMAPAEAPQPEITPLVEHWVPPNVDEVQPPVEPGTACDLPDILASAGKQLQHLPDTLDRFSATERLEHQSVSENGIASKGETVSFAYVVSTHETRRGSLNVEEYRNGTDDASVFPEHFATRGLPTQVFVFHPYYQDEFNIKCEGLARQGTGFAWQVHFEQKADVPSRMQVHYLNGRRYPVPLKGRAWIDSTSYQVVRLQTDLREPVKPAGLIAQHTDIVYGPVRFRKDNLDLWLPIRAEFFVQTKGHRVHRRHDFSDYVLFAVEDKQTIGKPRGTQEQQ
jgi:tetratricopeptide (TPR) repeat protein